MTAQSRAWAPAALFMTAACVLTLAASRVSGAQDAAAPAWAFLAALILLGMFDVWLPRGDSADMSGAVAFAAAVVLGPVVAALVVWTSRTVVFVLRAGSDVPLRAIEDMGRRASAIAVAVLTLELIDPGFEVSLARLPGSLLGLAVSAGVYFLVDLVLAQLRTSLRLQSPLIPLVAGNLRLQGWLSAAQVSAGVLAVLVWAPMGVWSLATVVVLLMTMRQSFSLLVEARAAYRATVEVLAQAIEAQRPEVRGHADRVARMSSAVARDLGWHGRNLENLTYAALFHEVGRISTETGQATERRSADVLSDVELLSGALPILRVLDEHESLADSYEEFELVAAYIVARECEFDFADRLGRSPSRALSRTVGARLYAARRAEVDRALSRVEHRASRGLPVSEEPVVEALQW